MTKNISRYLGWVPLGAGSIGATLVAIEALTLPFLHGSGLAQADFELFAVAIFVGVPAILLSVWGIFLLRRKQSTDKSQATSATALAVANTVVVVLSGAFALLIRTFGFFWK
jgi:hypothetical protein